MKRMKYVFPTDEIAHLWAHSHVQQGQARNPQGNFYFTGDTIYSYRDSYPIGRLVVNKRKESAVLIQIDKYGSTTAKHIGEVRQATSHMTQFTVPEIIGCNHWDGEREIEYKHGLNVKSYAARIAELEVKTMRARTNAEWMQRQLNELVLEGNAYCKFFSIRKTFKLTDPDTLKERVRLQAIKTREENARKEESRKRQEAQAILDAQKAVEEWKNGTGHYVPSVIKTTYLRIEGAELVTSRGARIPVDHARLGLAFVRRVKASGEPYQRNGHTFHLGHYAIDKIDADGNLTAGCHFITYAEIERIAPAIEAAEVTV